MCHVLIATAGAPEFLRCQARLLRALCTHPLNIVVVNDAKDFADHSNYGQVNAAAQISDACKEEGLVELRYPQHKHRKSLRPPRRSLPSMRTSEAIQFGYDHILRSGAKRIAVIDSDMFPFAPFSFSRLLGDADMAGVPQERTNCLFPSIKVRYLWNGLLILDVERMPSPSRLDFGCGYVNFTNTDTGGRIAHYLQRFPNTRVDSIPVQHSGCWNAVPSHVPAALADFIKSDPMNDGGFFSELYGDCLFHFRGGGNWQAVHGGPSFAARFKLLLPALGMLVAAVSHQ